MYSRGCYRPLPCFFCQPGSFIPTVMMGTWSRLEEEFFLFKGADFFVFFRLCSSLVAGLCLVMSNG